MKASNEVLARKYRPESFDKLIGQETISQTLSLALDANRLSHAYLFSGLRGSGKTSTARIFAKALVCEKGPTSRPCLQCEHCTMAKESRHMDIIEMDAASSRKIDDIRDLIEHTKYKPALRALYGPVDVVEMYIATEGTFAQQRDRRRLLVPNFDLYVLEVLGEDARVRMLHEMRPGEYGSLLVSTPVLPRYRIGDLVRAFDPPYFRCIGRESRLTKLRYWLDGIRFLDFGQA